MKKIIGLILIMLILSGCNVVYDLDNFVMPDDTEFMQVVQELDTPEKICCYMEDNFIYQLHLLYSPSPYRLWQTKKGDCNDFAVFGKFIAGYHGYETFLVMIYFTDNILSHAITVYQGNRGYTYSSNWEYFPLYVESIDKVIEHYQINDRRYSVRRYEVIG